MISFKSLLAKFISVSVTTTIATAASAATIPGYCVAIRGNGELVPAHWGAMANSIENFGVPSGMAGGSSGSITTFLWESMMVNPIVRKMDPVQKAHALALMFKSIEGMVDLELQKPNWQAIIKWIKLSQQPKGQQVLAEALQHLTQAGGPELTKKEVSLISKSIQILKDSGIFFGPAVKKLAASFENIKAKPELKNDPVAIKNLMAQVQDLKQTISVFGKFDAQGDKQLFIRDGLVDFKALALAIGELGDTLSLRNAKVASKELFSKYINDCASQTVGMSWSEISNKSPQCLASLKDWVSGYSGTYELTYFSRVNDLVGQNPDAPVLISTAVVKGADQVKRFLDIKAQYEQSHDPSIGGDMTVPSENLKFGYWGSGPNLSLINANLQRNIDKSERFLPLGRATWATALSLSPAEPGLSPFLQFSVDLPEQDLEKMISIGGWSDLHPIPVLKAMGCENVVYITRRGGDSLFGTGVAKRILGFQEPSWDMLVTQGDEAKKKLSNYHNMMGDSAPMNTQWSKMFSLKNPSSSFANSLAQASGVVCTDWNAYDITKDFHTMINQAYNSPIYLASTKLPMIGLKKNQERLTKDSLQKLTDGPASEQYPIFAGCIPQTGN